MFMIAQQCVPTVYCAWFSQGDTDAAHKEDVPAFPCHVAGALALSIEKVALFSFRVG